MIGDVELCRVFEREAPDGSVYLVGMLGDAGIAIVKDDSRPATWRVILSDPTRANNRNNGSTTRAIANASADDDFDYVNVAGPDFDELPDDV